MITLYNYPKEGVDTLTNSDGYFEITNEKEYEKICKEWKLLKDNCIDRYKLLNGEFKAFESMWFFDFVIGFRVEISKREAYYNKKFSIEKMKNYLGVWRR